MHSHCVCPACEANAPTIGAPLAAHPVGNWQALPEVSTAPATDNAEHVLKQCECGCNAYTGTSLTAPIDVDQLDIPVLPLIVEYEDDDGPSDDHEYVSIKITELADMASALRSCTCQDY